MDDSYKDELRNVGTSGVMLELIGSPVGHHGTYAFYKALRINRNAKEQIIAIGDFFFVRIWPDSELMAIGELQLLWTDRGAGRTLASLRLYFLPENTPAGRNQHGEDEVVGISERVVIKVEDLLSWICDGVGWRWGLRAPWSGDCTPIPAPSSPSPNAPPPLPTSTKLDFSDIDKEKALILDPEVPGVIVFSYPRYCRYRAMLRRIDGIAHSWLLDPLVAALGGYSAPTKNTRILYCKETFEYPELEGHEFVCNHMAPKLRGRVGRGRKRRARSASPSSASDSSGSNNRPTTPQGVKIGLRSSAPSSPSPLQISVPSLNLCTMAEDRAFVQRLRLFHKFNNTPPEKVTSLRSKKLKLRQLYYAVMRDGGYEEVTRSGGWKKIMAELAVPPSHNNLTQRQYERFLLPFEYSEKRGCKSGIPSPQSDGTSSNSNSPAKLEKKSSSSRPIDTIDISDSPIRELSHSGSSKNIPRLRTPPPGKRKSEHKKDKLAMLNGKKRNHLMEKHRKHRMKHEIHVDHRIDSPKEESDDDTMPENNFDPSNILKLNIGGNVSDNNESETVSMAAADLNQEFLDSLAKSESDEVKLEQQQNRKISVIPAEKLMAKDQSMLGITNLSMNGGSSMSGIEKPSPIRSRPSSLRSVRVKPDRRQGAQGSSPPSAPSTTPFLPPSQPSTGPPSDDDLIEVPYKPKSPEIIDLDTYESPDSPQSMKRKKLDMLKRGGLEVTTVRSGWPGLNPSIQHQILSKAQLLQMYGAFTPGQYNTQSPPKVTQGKSIYGSSSPEKIVYGNPKDPFMPPPHIIQGMTPRKIAVTQHPPSGTDILDLTCKPSVEIMRVAGNADAPQNLSAKKIPAPPPPNNEPRQINPALEITLVHKNKPPKVPQKRTTTGKFMPTSKNPYNQVIPNLSQLLPRNQSVQIPKSNSNHHAGANLVIPNYQVSGSSNLGNMSPNAPLGTNITPNFLQGVGGTLLQMPSLTPKTSSMGSIPLPPLLEHPLYINAFYSSLAGQLGPGVNYNTGENFLSRYPGIATGLGVAATPTSKS